MSQPEHDPTPATDPSPSPDDVADAPTAAPTEAADAAGPSPATAGRGQAAPESDAEPAATPERTPTEPAAPAAPDPAAATDRVDPSAGQSTAPPLTRIAERFRIPIGILVALVGIGLAVGFGLAGPAETELSPVRATVVRVAGIAIWALVAGVGITWALKLPRWSTNACAALAIASYGVVWAAGI